MSRTTGPLCAPCRLTPTTPQDAAATIKRQLQRMLPSVRLFLGKPLDIPCRTRAHPSSLGTPCHTPLDARLFCPELSFCPSLLLLTTRCRRPSKHRRAGAVCEGEREHAALPEQRLPAKPKLSSRGGRDA
eukprot:56294-Prymnesium_polylepis.1